MSFRINTSLFLFLTFFYFTISSQIPHPFQIGISTNQNLPLGDKAANTNIAKAFPGFPFPLTVNFKNKRHEFIVGADLYRTFVASKKRIIGLEASYRYHFYKATKRNIYLDVSAYYVKFASGTSVPVNYNYSSYDLNTECLSIYKTITPAASTCIGLELPFLKYFTFFSSVGAGIIYVHTDIDPSCPMFTTSTVADKFIPTVNIVAGFACYFYTKSPKEK